MNRDWLYSQWQQLLVNYGADKSAFDGLTEHYARPDRFYHNLEHLRHVLETINSLVHLARDPAAIRLAAWFHDVIYDSRAKDNEERSADYARTVLQGLGFAETTIQHVAELILLTKTHLAEPDDSDAQILLDADLAILGAPEEAYDRYGAAIRQEYAWVADDAYRAGRQTVLERFRQRPRIFLTEPMWKTGEQQARRNLEREIARLQAGKIPG